MVHLTRSKYGRRFARATSTVCQRRLPEPCPEGDPEVVSIRIASTTKISSELRQWRKSSLLDDHRVTSLCRSRLVSGQIGAGTDPFRSAARAYLLDYDVMPGQYPISAANLQWALVSHILLMPYSCATDMPSSQAMPGLVVLLRLHLPAISARESHCSPVVHVVG